MTQGPPPSAAGSSYSMGDTTGNHSSAQNVAPSASTYNPYFSSYAGGAYHGHAHAGTWQSQWHSHYSQNGASYAYPSPQQAYAQYNPPPQPTAAHPPAKLPLNPTVQSGAASPPPLAPTPNPQKPVVGPLDPPETFEHWDEILRAFLVDAKLTESLKGFEADMLVLSTDWEASGVQKAVGKMVRRLKNLPETGETAESLGERKLGYASKQLVAGETARAPTTMVKSISQFLARNRGRNNASNRTEFLYSATEKPSVSSCARTDARPVDRESQMKYDIAKNSDGPLSRTRAKGKREREDGAEDVVRKVRMRVDDGPSVVKKEEVNEELLEGTPSRYPALNERLKNIEQHFAVRYVPSPPRTLLARLKFLEEHIIQLEKEYPPWAALWFCQPGRGWPPPPRTTPIVVPSNLRAIPVSTSSNTAAAPTPTPPPMVPSTSTSSVGQSEDDSSLDDARLVGKPKGKPQKKRSSLHRAVMEKLEVKKALDDYRAGT